MNYIISLIIPVYNVEKYVEKCILSCINQCNFPVSDYEIIIINDGSQDRSIDIINNIEWNGISHKIISQNNMGLSMARNNGLHIAEGEYVWFIDSDDWISANALNILMHYLKLGIDAVSINAADVKEDSVVPSFNLKLNSDKVYSGKYLIKKHKWNYEAPFTIYRRQFLLMNNLYFKAGILHEDMDFTPRAYYLIESICADNTVLYFVRQNPESITRKFNSKKNFDLVLVAQSLSIYKTNNVKNYYRVYYNQVISLIINSSLNNNDRLTIKERRKLINIYRGDRYLFFNMIFSCKIKYFIEGLLFLCFPSHIFRIYNFLKYVGR